jgi:predicted amidophosphoribosyltransferase
MARKRRGKRKFCGFCGNTLTKGESVCSECESEWEDFKKPYHKLTWEMKMGIWAIIIVFGFLAAMFIIFFLLGIEVRMGLYPIGVLTFGFIYAILSIRVRIERGVKICRRCSSESSLNARYCIHCGKKIRWLYKIKW